MQYREFGHTGKLISALGFGAMRLPADEDYALQCMERYLDLGGNLIDTARVYGRGRNEELVGQVIRSRRAKVYLSTKNASITKIRYARDYAWSPAVWRQDFEDSLTALGVDCIDFYSEHEQYWSMYEDYFKARGPLDMALRAREEGLIAHLGFSCHDTPENAIRMLDEGCFDLIILQYNLLEAGRLRQERGRGTGMEPVIAHAAEKGIGVFVMGPLAGGRLTMGPAEQLRALCPPGVKSVAELALRFVLANPGVTSAMSGMNTLEMVEENCAVADDAQPLTPEQVAAIRQVTARNVELADLYCSGCGYCLPCPNEVAIPEIFEAMNLYRIWGLHDLARQRYAELGTAEKPKPQMNAEACTECEQCLPKCPQHLQIPEELRKCHETLF